jgi:hypothetical protein
VSTPGRLEVIAALAVGSLALIAASVYARRAEPSRAAVISAQSLAPPERYTAGLTQFINEVDEQADRYRTGQPGTMPTHASGLWGYYIALIDQEPWKALALAEQSRTGRGWPPLPLQGELLADPLFRDRVLELYVDITVLPNVDWAQFILRSSQRSAAASMAAEQQRCAYGSECLEFIVPDRGTGTINPLLRLWRWRVGRVVLSMSALGAPDWPSDAITPLLEYYTDRLAKTRGVDSNPPVSPPPPARDTSSP